MTNRTLKTLAGSAVLSFGLIGIAIGQDTTQTPSPTPTPMEMPMPEVSPTPMPSPSPMMSPSPSPSPSPMMSPSPSPTLNESSNNLESKGWLGSLWENIW